MNVLDQPFDGVTAQPTVYTINNGPVRQEIALTSSDDELIATLDRDTALELAGQLTRLAAQIVPGSTGWDLDGSGSWHRKLTRRASVDDELRDRDA